MSESHWMAVKACEAEQNIRYRRTNHRMSNFRHLPQTELLVNVIDPIRLWTIPTIDIESLFFISATCALRTSMFENSFDHNSAIEYFTICIQDYIITFSTQSHIDLTIATLAREPIAVIVKS